MDGKEALDSVGKESDVPFSAHKAQILMAITHPCGGCCRIYSLENFVCTNTQGEAVREFVLGLRELERTQEEKNHGRRP